MRRALRIATLSAFAGLIGFTAWQHPEGVLLLIVLPILLIGAKRRGDAALIMLGYFSINSAEIPGILLNFFDGRFVAMAYAAPIALALLQAAPFALIDPSAGYRVRALQAGLAFLMLTLPPLGFVGWLNPLFASASLFPGMGVFGIAATLLYFALVSALRHPARPREIVALAASITLPLTANAVATFRGPETLTLPIEAASTALGRPSEDSTYRERAWRAVEEAVRLRPDAALVVFPESIIHGFADVDRVGLMPLRMAVDRPEVWIGATKRREGEGRIENAIVQLDGSMVIRNRLPVPIGNWRPFTGSGAVAAPFASDLVRFGEHTLAVSICYEDGVLWGHPGLLTGQADALVSVSNHWALAGTRTARAQEVAAVALARMAGVPLKRSVNE